MRIVFVLAISATLATAGLLYTPARATMTDGLSAQELYGQILNQSNPYPRDPCQRRTPPAHC